MERTWVKGRTSGRRRTIWDGQWTHTVNDFGCQAQCGFYFVAKGTFNIEK